MPMVEGGRPIARFSLFGFPVTIDISFVIIVALLGWYPGVDAQKFIAWFLLVPVAVLVHELGHAFVARTTGAQPSITLAGLGGLTSYLPPHRLSRARSVAISLAGPAVGIVVGLALLAYRQTVGADSPTVLSVVDLAIFTTLGWSGFNLLPILPLDGGQTLRELLPGSPAKREVRAATVSVVVAVLAALVALRFGLVFGALFAGFLVFSNVMTVRNARDQEKVDVNQRAVQLLWARRPTEARDLLAERPDDAGVHPLVRSAVRAAAEDPRAGTAELEAAADRDPADPQPPSLLLIVHRVRDDWPAARDLLLSPRGRMVDPSTVLAVQTVAFQSGASRESAEIGEAFLQGNRVGAAGDLPALIAYNVACGWAKAGELPRGLQAFRRAADLGFADLTAVDSDDDIAPLRPLPGYDEARQQIRQRALAVVDEQQSP
jgi:Zn-dependent protease